VEPSSITIELPPGELFPVTELPRRPWMPRRKGKPISAASGWRHVLRGKGGVKLRSLKVGGIRCTTDAWALSYFEHLSTGGPAQHTPARTRDRRVRDLARAERELAAAGL
jgi:hypothetical protein